MDLLGLRYAAEAAQGRPVRVFGGESLLDVLLFRFRKMAGDFVVEVAIHLPRTKKGPQTEQEGPQARHETFSEIFKKRSTMSAARSHCASSWWSWLRPSRVSA